MSQDFSDHFWGSKNNGFDVLYQNLKFGISATKELVDFFRERSQLEEANSKALLKLLKSSGNYGSVGNTLAPFWTILRGCSEQMTLIQGGFVTKIQDIVKDVIRYSEELSKKCKQVKEEESSTIESIQLLQSATITVQKTKEIYFTRVAEAEKFAGSTATVHANSKELEKIESKSKKAFDDYRLSIEKYNLVREDFERKMIVASKHFQDVENDHLHQIKSFLITWANIMEENNQLISIIQSDFKLACEETKIDYLIEQFINHKGTGIEKPAKLEVEEIISNINSSLIDVSLLNQQQANPNECNNEETIEKKREGFLRSIRDKKKTDKKEKPNKGKNVFADMSITDQNFQERSLEEGVREDLLIPIDADPQIFQSSSLLSASTSILPQKPISEIEGKIVDDVDEEGYSIPQIKNNINIWENEKSNFYSSDSDSDSDYNERRIHVEIKPLNNGQAPLSASVDELRSTVQSMNMTLPSSRNIQGNFLASQNILPSQALHSTHLSQDTFNTTEVMKRSQSMSISGGNDVMISSTNISTNHPYTPLSPTHNIAQPYIQSSSIKKYSELGDLFSDVGSDIFSAIPSKRSTSPPNSTSIIPRPPSRASSVKQSVGILDYGGISATPYSTINSRGPSPLLESNSIPLAVAFHEIIHASFILNDESKTRVKITGDLMLSFPAGIIQIYSSTSPVPLFFRVKTMSTLVNLQSNHEIVKLTENTIKNGESELFFEFNMNSLFSLLQKHSEQNPNASYFNVDILKYQIPENLGVAACPLHLVAFWKCETSQTDLRIDYKYNGKAFTQLNTSKGHEGYPSLVQVCVAAPVDGGVKTMQSKPNGQWFGNSNRAVWKIGELSEGGLGSLRARFELSDGQQSKCGTIAAQFSCENSTLSGSEIQGLSQGYRISLIKKRFVSGKYTCDSEVQSSSPASTSLNSNITTKNNEQVKTFSKMEEIDIIDPSTV